MPTIYDIAKATSVSPATVSRVINGRPGVNEATVNKVKRAMEKANFQPRWKAVDKRRFLILVPSHAEALGDPSINRILTGIADACFADNFAMVMRPFPKELQNGSELRELVINDGGSGVILLSMQEGYALADMIGMEHIPHVVIGHKAHDDNRNQILLNDYDGAVQATRHLLDLGHREIAMISFNHRELGHGERYKGYAATMKKMCPEIKPRCVQVDSVEASESIRAVQQLFDDNPPPTALLITVQALAHGVITELEKRKKKLPGDCSIVIFQDTPSFDFLPMPLTSIRVPSRRMGAAAVRQLMESLSKTDAKPLENKVTRFSMELVLRNSTAPAPPD